MPFADDYWAGLAAGPSSSQPQDQPAQPKPQTGSQPIGSADDYWANLGKVSDDEYAARSKRAGLSVGRTPQEHEDYLRESKRFTSEGAKSLAGDYAMEQTRQKFAGEVPGGTLEQFARNSLPFGDLLDTKGHKDYAAAKAKLDAGDRSQEVMDTVARYERLQEVDRQMGEHTGTAAIQALGAVPKMVAEAWAGGKVLSLAGKVTPGLLGRVMTGEAGAMVGRAPLLSAAANPTFMQAVGTHVGRMALMTPLMPSMYLDEARTRNMEANRNPDDWHGMTGSLLHGYANMLVLGTLQKNLGGANLVNRSLRKGAVGVGEQQVVDTAAGLWDQVAPEFLQTRTRFGVLGSLARGDLGEAAHHATIQAMTFAAFGALHDPVLTRAREKVRDAAEFYAKEVDKARDAGATVDEAVKTAGEKVEAKAAEEIKKEDNETIKQYGDRVKSASLKAGDNSAIAEQKARMAVGAELAKSKAPPPEAPPEIKTADDAAMAAARQAKAEGKNAAQINKAAMDAWGKWHANNKPAANVRRVNTADEIARLTELEKTLKPGDENLEKTRNKIRELQDRLSKGVKEYDEIGPTEATAATPEATVAELTTEPGTGVPPGTPVEATGESPTIAPVASGGETGKTPTQPPIVEPGATGAIPEPSGGLKARYEAAKADLGLRGAVERAEESYTGESALSDADVAATASSLLGRTVSPEEVKLARQADISEAAAERKRPAHERAATAVDRSPGLTPEMRTEYKAAVSEVFGRMPADVLAIANATKGFRFYPDPADPKRAVIDQFAQTQYFKDLSAAEKQYWLDLRNDSTVGAIEYNGVIHIDGRAAAHAGRYGSRLSKSSLTTDFLAHELGHIFETRGNTDLIKDPAYLEAFEAEVAERPGDKESGDYRLTDYAASSPREGFAEFTRLLFGTEVPTAQIEREFPKLSAFFQGEGIWPKERGKAGGTRVKLENIFSHAEEMGDGNHIDVLLGDNEPPPVETVTPKSTPALTIPVSGAPEGTTRVGSIRRGLNAEKARSQLAEEVKVGRGGPALEGPTGVTSGERVSAEERQANIGRLRLMTKHTAALEAKKRAAAAEAEIEAKRAKLTKKFEAPAEESGPLTKEQELQKLVAEQARDIPFENMTDEQVKAEVARIKKSTGVDVTNLANVRRAKHGGRKKVVGEPLTAEQLDTLASIIPDERLAKGLEVVLRGGSQDQAGRAMGGISGKRYGQLRDRLFKELGIKDEDQLRDMVIPVTEEVTQAESIGGERATTESPDQSVEDADWMEYAQKIADKFGINPEDVPHPMRVNPEPPKSENERLLAEEVQRDPRDLTARRALADAIGEAGDMDRMDRIHRELDNPPSERGVSDWRQLGVRQLQRIRSTEAYGKILREMRQSGEAAGGESDEKVMDRYWAWLETATGSRPKNSASSVQWEEIPNRGELKDYGTRFYKMASYSEANAILTQPMWSNDFMYVDNSLTTDPGGRTGDTLLNPTSGIVIEFRAPERGTYASRLLNPFGGEQIARERYTNGGAIDVTLDDGMGLAKGSVMSATFDTKQMGDYNSTRSANLIKELELTGWRKVDLGDGKIRLDSPLRQQIRDEQARGYRTGEPAMMRVPRLAELADKVVGGEEGKRRWGSIFKRILTGPGDMPQSGFEEKLAHDSQMKAHAFDVANAAKDLESKIGDWRTVPKQVIETIDGALRGTPEDLAKLKPEIRLAVQSMRDHVDAMADHLIAIGAVPEKLIPIFNANRGVYLTRQYRVFDDPRWYEKVRKLEGGEVINRFKAWFSEQVRKDGRDLADVDLDAVVDSLLRDGTAAENPIAFLASGRLGQKDLSILTARKDVPEPLRALWGEVKDPIANYATSIGRMAQLGSSHVFMSRIKDVGLKEGWLSEGAPKGENTVALADKDSKVMDVLAGLYTTPEIKAAFKEVYSKRSLPEYLKAYTAVLGAFKYGKTVLSLVSHVRQTAGNVFFNLGNGHTINRDAVRMFKEMAQGTEEGRAYQRRLIELGVDDQSVRGGEFGDIMRDAAGAHDPFTWSTQVADNALTRWLKKGRAFAEKLYRYEDLAVKVNAFENEKARYRKAMPELGERDLEQLAARIVQDTFPTYSRIPGGVKALRMFPIMGPFVSFTSEVIRTTYNTARLAAKELGDPRTREIGAKRLAGQIASLSAFAALGVASRMLAGISLDEEDAIRQDLPEWNRDGQLLHLGKDSSGKYRVVDLGRTDPHSYLWEPLQAGLTGARSGTGTPYDVLEAAAKPWIGEELGTRALLDVARNKTEKATGGGKGQVYNPEASTLRQSGQVLGHAWRAFEPGLVDQVGRLGQAASGIRSPLTGKEYSLGEEFLADVSGQRVVTVSPAEALVFRARAFRGRKEDAERPLNEGVRLLQRQGVKPTAEELSGAAGREESMRMGVYDDLMADVRAARLLGLSDSEIARKLKEGGVSTEDLGIILGGKYRGRDLGRVLNPR